MSPTPRVKKSINQASRTGVSANVITRSQSTRAILPTAILNNAVPSTSSVIAPERRITTISRNSAANGVRRQRMRVQHSTTRRIPSSTQRENNRQDHLEHNTPTTPENDQTSVLLVDLITPLQPSVPAARPMRPLEVDLTCDLDDEVFVVLEDIVNPSRRPNSSDLPVLLGSSPPRARQLGPRNLRSTFGNRQDISRIQHLPGVVPVESTPSPCSSSVQQEGSHQIHCPICLDSLSQVKQANQQMHSTICGHLFCGPCIRRVIASTQQCPTCRQKLDIRKIHPIFI